MDSITFDRLEEYGDASRAISAIPYVVCSFETNRFGYYQVQYSNEDGLTQLGQEPSLDMFTSKQIYKIRKICAIVYRMVYDVPAMTDRFS